MTVLRANVRGYSSGGREGRSPHVVCISLSTSSVDAGVTVDMGDEVPELGKSELVGVRLLMGYSGIRLDRAKAEYATGRGVDNVCKREVRCCYESFNGDIDDATTTRTTTTREPKRSCLKSWSPRSPLARAACFC